MNTDVMSGKYRAYPEYKDSGVEWLGDIPSSWKLCRLKFMAKIKNGQDYKSVQVDEGYPVMGSGGQFTYASEFMYDRESVLLGRKGTIDKPLYIDEPFWSVDTMYYTEVNKEVHAKYLYYLALTIQFDRYSTNTALPSMTQEHLGNFTFAIPNGEDDKKKIANFLDHETAKIDTLIEKQQQLIALLKEKRKAVISHAVTKGLNPNAPMKDSGVEWLGDVPEHWEVSQIKYKVKPGTSITYGIVQAGPHIDDGIPYIKTSDMSGSELPIEGYSKTSEAIDDSYKRSKVYEGDIVMAIRATVGKCLPVPKEISGANLTQGTAKIAPGCDLSAEYLLSYLSSSQVQTHLNSMAKGATFKEITLDMLRRVSVLVPPQEEQDLISNKVSLLGGKFTKLISASEEQMRLLSERRTALISAAVTGKIDVRNWVEPEASSIKNKEVA